MENSSFLSNFDSFASDDNGKPSISHLEEKIAELTAENESYKAQFETLLQQTQTIHENCEKIKKLTKENLDLKAENEEIQHRLELSNKKYQELAQQYDDEKQKSSTIKSNNFISQNQELETLKEKFQKQIHDLQQNLSELQKQNTNLLIEQKTINNKIDRSLSNASRFFQNNFDTLDSFNNFLSSEQYPKQQQIQQPQQQIPIQQPIERSLPQQNNAEYEQKISKLKSTIKELKSENREFESENKLLKENNNKLSATIKTNANEMKKKYNNDINELTNKFNNEKKALETENSTLKKNLQQIQRDLNEARQKPAQIIKETIVDTKKLEEQKRNFDIERKEYYAKIKQLSDQLKAIQESRDETLVKLNKINADNTTLLTEVEKQKVTISSMATNLEESKNEIESLRAALHNKEAQKVVQEAPQRSEADKLRIEQLKKNNENLEKKTIDLQATINQKDQEIFNLQKEKKELETEIKQKNAQEKEMKLDIQELQQKINDKPIITADVLLPPNTWTTSIFGPNIAQSINVIANNNALQPVSKLHNIYDTIHKEHKEQEKEMEEKLEQLSNNLQSIRDSISTFIIDCSVALFDKALTYDDFLANKAGDNIIKAINENRDLCENLKHNDEYLRSVLDSISQQLDSQEGNYDEILVKIMQLMKENEELNMALENIHSKYKQTKEAFKFNAKKMQHREYELTSQKEAVQNDLENAQNEIEELTDQLNQIKVKNEEANNEINRLKEIESAYENEIQQRDLISEPKEEHIDVNKEKEQNETIEKLEKQIQEKEEKEIQLCEEISNLKHNLQLLDNEKEQIQSDFEQFKEKTQEEIANEKKRYEVEKENAQEIFQSTVEELKKQCQVHREDIQKLSLANAQAESFITQSKAIITKLNGAKRKAENDLKLLKQQSDRQLILNQATLNARLSTAEAEHQTQLEQIRSDFEKEKRSIYSSFVSKFRNYYNPSSCLNERTYNKVIETVSEELNRLKASDTSVRTMLHVNDNQTTEDAVAQILLKGC